MVPKGLAPKEEPCRLWAGSNASVEGELRISVVVLKQTDGSDELGTVHLQSRSLSRQERTSPSSQSAKGAFQDRAWDWRCYTIKRSRLKNKYHYWWQLSKRTEKNKIRHNLFRQDHMFECSTRKSAQFTCCKTVCMSAPSQGKELGLKSRLSGNHRRAQSLLQGLASQISSGQPLSAADLICASAWCAWKEMWEVVYIRGAEQTVENGLGKVVFMQQR